MLRLMRKHARNWLMKVVLGIIIVVFVFYFGSLRGRRQTETIAIINKAPISRSEYVKEYHNVIDMYRQRFGNNLTDDFLKALNPKQQAFDNLINKAIILTKADEFKLNVSEEEIKESIFNYPAFQRNGVFDKRIYEQRLRFQRLTPEDFEALQKRMLRIEKLERLIRESAKISEGEVYDIYGLQNQKIKVDFIKIAAKDFADKVTPTGEKLGEYLKEHGEEFRIPKKAQLKYITYSGKDFAGEVTVSDEEIEDYYNYHQDEFTDDEKKVYPLSEVKDKILPKLKLAEGIDIAHDRAKKAHDIIYQEENFEDYAKKNDLTTNTAEIFYGGSLLPAQLAKLKDLSEYAFDAYEGEIIPVLSDDTGHYVFKVISIENSYLPELTEVKDKVKARYVDDASRKLGKERAESILDRLKKGENIEKLSRKEDYEISESDFFLPGSNIAGIGFSEELGEALFELSEKKITPDDVFYIDGNFVIIQFKTREKLDEKDWEEKKESLRTALLEMKGERYFHLWLEETKSLMIKKGELEILKDIESL
ncbi:MAG: SurA N-terminal domain-containing protein [Thermodesulfobacteriota bacterium]|nr:SurA N-terminal domain-containing protein [Thermodesulfobacteriota bacterium]